MSAESSGCRVDPAREASQPRLPTCQDEDDAANRTTAIVEEYREWLSTSHVPKLFVNAEPGALVTGRARELVRTWPNQTEITVPGTHFIQEDSPDEIGAAVADFVRRLCTDG